MFVMQKFLRPAEFYAARQSAMLETPVGSCVTVCLYNFHGRFGAMNRFLQPRPRGAGVADPGTYGTATGYIVEAALRMDGDRSPYRAHVFGGAAGLKTWQTDECLGEMNVQAALETLRPPASAWRKHKSA